MPANQTITLMSHAVVYIFGYIFQVEIFLLVAVSHRGLDPDWFVPLPHKACLVLQKPGENSALYFLSC